MTTHFPDTDPLDTFTRVEQEIRSSFDAIIRTATIRRDELLQQLFDLKRDYLNKEELRKKQVRELEQMVSQLDDICVQQNTNLKIHEENLVRTKDELRKAEKLTPVPLSVFISEDLQPLLQQLAKMGTIEEVSRLYTNKLRPVRIFNSPFSARGIRIDEEERMYVCDGSDQIIQVFSKECRLLKEFGKGKLIDPHDIALHGEWAFICDGELNSILKFQISSYKLVSNNVGVLNHPLGLTVDRNEVLVADNANNRIAVLNLDLEYLREIGKGVLLGPCDVKVNINKIFVLDNSKPHNVRVFSKSADLLYSMISVKNGTGSMFMCLDQFSNIIISDFKDKSIQIFTLEGQLIHSIQCVEYPRGVAVTNNNTIVCAELSSITFY